MKIECSHCHISDNCKLNRIIGCFSVIWNNLFPTNYSYPPSQVEKGGGGALKREGGLNRGNTVFDIYGPLLAALMRFAKIFKKITKILIQG